MATSMAGPIGWIVRMKIKPGNADAFRKIVEGAVAAVRRTEPGTVVYEVFLYPDGSTCEFHEWFQDQDAALAHLTGVAPREYLPKALQVADFVGMDLYGTPSPEVAKALEAFPVKGRNSALVGFTRPPR